jgi:hypothetical protein
MMNGGGTCCVAGGLCLPKVAGVLGKFLGKVKVSESESKVLDDAELIVCLQCVIICVLVLTSAST